MEDQLKKMEIRAQLTDLEVKLANMNDSLESFKEGRAKEKRLNNQCLELEHSIQRIMGEQGELSKRVDEIRRKLGEDRYKNAQLAFRNKFIEKVVMERTIEDLNKYWKVMDDTIISFHSSKMEQINFILQDLWAKVYQGNDIETIKIKYEFLKSLNWLRLPKEKFWTFLAYPNGFGYS